MGIQQSMMSVCPPRSPCLRGAVFFLLLFSGCTKSVDVDLAKKFQAAQQAFDEARKPEDFAKAAVLDQEILDRGGVSRRGALQPGQCVDAGRATRPAPSPPIGRPNAISPGTATWKKISSPRWAATLPATHRPVLETILFWQNWLSYPEKFYLAAAAAIATFLVAAVGLCSPGGVRCAQMVWAGLLAYRRAGVLGRLRLASFRFHTEHGVITQQETIARKGNSVSYEPAFKGPLREATEFQLRRARGDWLLIQLPGDGEGWIEEKAAVTY